MFIEQFYYEHDQKISFSREQASDFAKNICDDFNPIHNINAKRFCVPGDLLFAIILSKTGLSEKMNFSFKGMVTDGIKLTFPTSIETCGAIVDDNGKEYLTYNETGKHSKCETLITSLIRSYVEFSGHTFPHILGDLMAENNVIINSTRPMVMYENMEINLNRLDVEEVSLEFNEQETKLTVDGKRGKAKLVFNLLSGGEIIGYGIKHMLLSGLKPYCKDQMQSLTEQFYALKDSHTNES